MGKRMNWGRVHEHAAMRRHGTEDVRGKVPDMAPLYPRARSWRRQLSKAEQRAQTAALVAKFTGKITRG